MGRPFGTFKYDNLEDLEADINKYFDDCDTRGRPYTMEGLAYSLNITTVTLANYSREDYATGKDGYFNAINRARQRCLQYKAERLYDKDGVQGAKFDLCNNSARMGGLAYSDKQEISVRDNTPPPDADAVREQIKAFLAGLSDDEKAALGGADDG